MYDRDWKKIEAAVYQAVIAAGDQVAEAKRLLDRAASLGIEHVYQGTDDKLTAYHDLLARTGFSDEEKCGRQTVFGQQVFH